MDAMKQIQMILAEEKAEAERLRQRALNGIADVIRGARALQAALEDTTHQLPTNSGGHVVGLGDAAEVAELATRYNALNNRVAEHEAFLASGD
jgi:dsDNA-specific endonuclease/ATPase MutS2